MKNIICFILLFCLFSCINIIKSSEDIKNAEIKVGLFDLTDDAVLYHIYFKNIYNKKKSTGYNIFDISSDISFYIYPGVYNIYTYGLFEKTSTSLKVLNYDIRKNIDIFNDSNKNIQVEMKLLTTSYDVEYDSKSENAILKIHMNEIYDIFSLSSISVRQGEDRVRSLSYYFDERDLSYIVDVPLYENGDWFMNISYKLKSKIDDDLLDGSDIYISTSYFKDIYLGEYFFIEL